MENLPKSLCLSSFACYCPRLKYIEGYENSCFISDCKQILNPFFTSFGPFVMDGGQIKLDLATLWAIILLTLEQVVVGNNLDLHFCYYHLKTKLF